MLANRGDSRGDGASPTILFLHPYRFALLKSGGWAVDVFLIGNYLMVKFILLYKRIAIYKIIIHKGVP